jgi:pimeloyl-ACP methyl ester carboxylesterase
MNLLRLGKGVLCLWVGTLVLTSSCQSIHHPSALDHLHACKSSEGPTDAYCGKFDVWENRETKTGRKLSLNIVVLPALKQNFAPDPVFFLAGGPGQGAASLAEPIEEPFHRLQTSRDLVLIDQRGTGKSNPLACKGDAKSQDEELSDAQQDSEALRIYHACLDSYANKADVKLYTTSIAMDDIDDVRAFLGYPKINLFGVSYGTRAAIVYARRHPDHTRAVVLDSVAPPDMRLPLYVPRDSQRSLDLLFTDCEKDPGCSQRFPHIRQTFNDLIARLTAHPEHIHFIHPRTGEPKEIDAKRLIVSLSIFRTLYDPLASSLLPLLIEQASKGNYTGFLALAGDPDPKAESQLARGMQLSVVCSEDATRIEPGAIARGSAGTFMGTDFADALLKPCAFWPRGTVEPAYFDNTPSDLPALILSGQLDPITPPIWGQQVAAQWKNSKNVVVPGSGHGAWSHGCVLKLIDQFLNAGSAANLDTSCVNQVARPPFFLGPSGPNPLAGGLATK